MKKFLIILATLVVACTTPTQEVKVRFHTNLIENGSLTRASDHDEILNLITSTYPKITPKVWYSESEKVTIPLNEEVNVRVGSWLFAWECPSITQITPTLLTAYFALTPYMDISTYINITPGVTEYTIPVNVESVAFIWNINEVSKVTHNANNGNLPNTKIDFGVSSANYTAIFLNGCNNSDESILMLRVYPQDESGKVTTFYFSNYYDNWQGNPTYPLTYGHYYVLHPDSVTELDASFSVSLPSWECDLD